MLRITFALAVVVGISTAADADPMTFESFDDQPEARWAYIADGVMGGVSRGQARFETEGNDSHVHLTGTVSTENNGGFIQVRRLLPDALPVETKGLVLESRGNGEAYYLFIRTKEMMRPWYYYSAEITPGADWTEIDVPFTAFERSHAHLAETIAPDEVVSLGIVAYGRDHLADISVRSVALY